MDKAKAIEACKQAAKTNQAINDMFHDFALRERARGQITVRAFYNRMKKQGFEHNSLDYAEGLKLLAECGFGELRRGKKGSVIGLFGVKTALQSLGQVVVGKRRELKNYAPRAKYSPIAVSTPPVSVKAQVLQDLSGVDNLVRAILQDDSIPPMKRIDAARLLLDTQ